MNFIEGSEPLSFTGKSNVGILIIHGFTGTTSGMFPLAEAFIKSDYHIECPRLSGHGTNWQDLNNITYDKWINDIENSLSILKKRTENIFVVGLSMGGALTLYLAENHPEIKGIAIINHLLIIRDIRIFFLPLIKHFIKSVPAIANDVKDPNVKEIAYDRTPTKALHQLMKLTKIIRKNLYKIEQPTLIFKSMEDHVIPIVNAKYTYDKISSKDKEIIWLNNSYHVATIDFDKDIIIQKIDEFIKRLI